MKTFALLVLGALLATEGFSYQQYDYGFPKQKNSWEQDHLQSDGRGGFYNHKPGTGIWQDEHITPDGRGGFYNHTPGTGIWQDQHATPDGRGGFYY